MRDAAKQNSNSAIAENASDGLDTIKTLAPKLRRSPRTVQAWMRAGKLPYFKVGKSVLFRWPDVLEALNRFRVN
jgi:excisionase family DNA binding protein